MKVRFTKRFELPSRKKESKLRPPSWISVLTSMRTKPLKTSFFVKEIGAVRTAIQKVKKISGLKFKTRKWKKGYRVWRVKK